MKFIQIRRNDKEFVLIRKDKISMVDFYEDKEGNNLGITILIDGKYEEFQFIDNKSGYINFINDLYKE